MLDKKINPQQAAGFQFVSIGGLLIVDSTAKILYNCRMSEKIKTTIVFTEEAKKLLEALAKKYGVSQTAILEMLLREKAKQEGLWQ